MMNDNSETLRNGLMELTKMQFRKLITCHKLISNLVICDFLIPTIRKEKAKT